MADAYLVKQGAAGSGSDECTANRKHVLAPYTAITGDSGDDPTIGTMLDQSGWKKTLAAGESVTVPGGYHDGKGTVTAKDLASQTGGTAADSDIRKGKTAVANGKTITGTQEDRGAWSSTGLLAGQSVTIPAGIHNGSGKITTASLASQTAGATAEDKYVKKGLKYWKDGVLRTGTMEIQSAISFSAAALSHNTIRVSWKNPAKGPWEGIRIQMSTDGTPGASGGTRVYTGAGSNPNQANGNNYADITGLKPLTKYYFSCTSFCTGLDDGIQADVSATTTHVYLYNRGNNIAGISVSDEYTYNGGITFASNAIVYSQVGSSPWTGGTLVTNGKWDLSAFSKFKMRCKISSARYDQFYVNVFGKQNSDFDLLANDKVSLSYSEMVYESDLRSAAKNFNDRIYFQLYSASSGNAVAGILGEIYEIWLE